MAFLIHDNDTKLTFAIDSMFSTEVIEILPTPYQSPCDNSFAERRVRSVHEECLDHIIVVNESHLRNLLRRYTDYYNHSRPHLGIIQHFPGSGLMRSSKGPIRRQDILRGIIHDYSRQSQVLVSDCE
ncbi:MAG: transposase [Anaerolineales bacterium]|nr:transposase [Anaerolineales bacterium]